MRVALLTALAACGPSKEPAAPAPPVTEPAVAVPSSGSGSGSAAPCEVPPAGEAMTEVQCTCQGGRLNASRGGADQPSCDPNEESIGAVRFGIEGGWCCRASAIKSPRP